MGLDNWRCLLLGISAVELVAWLVLACFLPESNRWKQLGARVAGEDGDVSSATFRPHAAVAAATIGINKAEDVDDYSGGALRLLVTMTHNDYS